MCKKETTTMDDVMTILKILEDSNIIYWVDGGWGIDILAGKQTRTHRDIDIDFDAKHTDELLTILGDCGYVMDTDLAPVRMELYHEKLGYLDIHPFVINEDGSAKQADLEGGWYVFEADFFGSGNLNGKTIPCISAKGQKIFHTGYELREVDVLDLEILKSL